MRNKNMSCFMLHVNLILLFMCFGGYYNTRLVSLRNYTKRQILVIDEIINTLSSGGTYLFLSLFLIGAVLCVTEFWWLYT